MVRSPSSSQLGGPGPRTATPAYSADELQRVLEQHVVQMGCSCAFDLDAYNHLHVNQAVRGAALTQNGALIERLLSVAPSGYLLYSASGLATDALCSASA